MPASRYRSEISIILLLFQIKGGKSPKNDFTVSIGWNGCTRGSIPLASHCLSNTKKRKIDF
nr:MAG TPA_asm: hypothetical protein [Caudoviricetes sp.]